MKQWTKPDFVRISLPEEDIIRTSGLNSSASGKGVSLDWSAQYSIEPIE